MLDFIRIAKRNKNTTIYPDFVIDGRTTDLMIRGHSFYAVWDEEKGLWSRNEYDVQRLVDKELYSYNEQHDNEYTVDSMSSWTSKSWDSWSRYIRRLPDNYHELDTNVVFANTDISKESYASKRLNYNLVEEETPAYTKLMQTLYDPEELEKLEWAIGSIISGDSKTIQKFIVLYGSSGSGKSTFLNIVEMLFDGYYSYFEAKTLASSNNSFALEAFKNDPLIAIQHDGDLSRIEDNTKLNSIISHETMVVNEKFKNQYEMRFHSFLFMGTNSLVKITDARSGMNRRLIDVHPSERKVSFTEYNKLMGKIPFELGGIAYHCLDIYQKRGKAYYNTYIPISMIGGTNSFYDFVCENYDTFKKEDQIALKPAWTMYNEYVAYAKVPYPLTLQKFKEELKSYFRDYVVNSTINGKHVRNTYFGFRSEKIDGSSTEVVPNSMVKISRKETWLNFEECESSIFDIVGSDYPAQYANEEGKPSRKWENVSTTLKDISTHALHYVRVPLNHIVIDFDIKGPDGKKNLDLNIEAASKFPETYAELSKSGSGIHLHYIYDGDVQQLSRVYGEDIEIKIFNGQSSLRRLLTKCVNKQIAHINSGLPLKKEGKTVINDFSLKNEKAIRTIVQRNLKKEYWPNTKPSVDYIYKTLDDAYKSGMDYDISDMRPAVQAFALNSTHNAEYCLKLVGKMKFKSEDKEESPTTTNNKDPLIFFDVEVFPNLFVICWKEQNTDGSKDQTVHSMVNPSPNDIDILLDKRLVGFNNRRYDNHIVYARTLGYSNEELFRLSNRIINSNKGENSNCFFREAYNLSYTDIYDFASASNKKSLKKWEIELGINHHENAYPWDQPVSEEHWDEIVEYCCDDVRATEAVFDHLHGDFMAREILADIADGSPNDTTNTLTTKIIFGHERNPTLEYPDISNEFPGYEFVPCGEDNHAHNMYHGIDVGFGGWVWSNPGTYEDVITFDVASMHPSSIIALNLFGDYTKKFKELLDARLAIKHKDYDALRTMLDGKLAKYVDEAIESGNENQVLKAVSNALKTAINSVYGLTSASFQNPFRDKRNLNNIVALRGALFMVNLKEEVEKKGFKVVHIKTDSIKVEKPTEELKEFIFEYGQSFGYTFEIEHIFEKICLVNDAVYIAKLSEEDPEYSEYPNGWTATGAQFKVPYVFKKLFSKEEITFDDLCETKSVKTALYLDMNENLPEDEHNYVFVGRVGLFTPVKAGCNGGILLRDAGNGKYAAATGSKGYRWVESETIRGTEREQDVDTGYFDKMVTEAINTINEYGNYWELTGELPF